MPGSNPENRTWVLNKAYQLQPKTVIDVGPGAGAYGLLLKPFITARYVGVEIFPKNVETYDLRSIYDEIIIGDIREFESLQADLIIFGDVLEHMTREEAMKVWDVASKGCKYAILSIPIIYYPQDEVDGNVHERHVVNDWDNIKVFQSFKNIIECRLGAETGAYLAKFEGIENASTTGTDNLQRRLDDEFARRNKKR